jgi:hypothetical protein
MIRIFLFHTCIGGMQIELHPVYKVYSKLVYFKYENPSIRIFWMHCLNSIFVPKYRVKGLGCLRLLYVNHVTFILEIDSLINELHNFSSTCLMIFESIILMQCNHT